jgi:hypothetical protein
MRINQLETSFFCLIMDYFLEMVAKVSNFLVFNFTFDHFYACLGYLLPLLQS